MRILALLIFAIISPLFAYSQSVLRGVLVGFEGSPVASAGVSWREYGTPESLVRVLTDEHGTFQIVTGRQGSFSVWFIGPHHEVLREFFYVESGDTLQISVRLPTPAFNSELDSVMVITFDSLDSEAGNDFLIKKNPDGIFEARVPSPADTVIYQLAGVVKDYRPGYPRLFNGTQRSRYYYDGRGGYVSVIEATGDSTTITFDPKKLPPSGMPGAVKIICDDCIALKHQEFGRKLDSIRTLTGSEYRQYRDVLLGDIPEMRDSIRHQFAMMLYLEMAGTKHADSALTALILEEVPPESMLWGMGRDWLYYALVGAGRVTFDAMRGYTDRVIAGNPNREVVAAALSITVFAALRDSNHTALSEYLEKLLGEYGDSYYAKYAAKHFNNGPVKIGQALPDEVRAILRERFPEVERLIGDGTPVLLEFWASWCGPCRDDWGGLRRLHRDYAPEQLMVFGFALESEVSLALSQEEGSFWKVDWKNYQLDGGFSDPLFIGTGGIGIPWSVFIDSNGIVRGLRKSPEFYRGLLEGRVEVTE